MLNFYIMCCKINLSKNLGVSVMDEMQIKERLKNAIRRSNVATNGQHLKMPQQTPKIQRTDNVYKQGGQS